MTVSLKPNTNIDVGDTVAVSSWPVEQTATVLEFIQDGLGWFARLSTTGQTFGIGALVLVHKKPTRIEPV